MKEEKIKIFISDATMSEAVYGVLLKSFLKPKPLCDVNLLAASRLAIDLLQDAWKELDRFKADRDSSPQTLSQVGL